MSSGVSNIMCVHIFVVNLSPCPNASSLMQSIISHSSTERRESHIQSSLLDYAALCIVKMAGENG